MENYTIHLTSDEDSDVNVLEHSDPNSTKRGHTELNKQGLFVNLYNKLLNGSKNGKGNILKTAVVLMRFP